VRQSALYRQVVEAKPTPAPRAAHPFAPCLYHLRAGRRVARARRRRQAVCACTKTSSHTHKCVRTSAYVCNPMRSPETPRKAGYGRERTTKRLQMEAKIIAHAWLTPAIFLLYALREGGTLRASDRGRSALPTCMRKPRTPKPSCLPACCLLPVIIMDWTVSIHLGSTHKQNLGT
jgi:hypothetical protein